MANASGIKHYGSREDYIKRRGASSAKSLVDSQPKSEIAEKLSKKAHKVELSDDVKKQIKDDGKTLKKAGSHLVSDAASTLAKALPSPIPISIPTFKGSKSVKDVKSVSDIKELMPIEKPAVFFVSGLHLGSVSSDDGGLPDMAKAVKDGEHFSWQDEDKVFSEIMRRPSEEPVVLVGHSLGGDAVVNLANRLNTLEGGFRKVNLLVTLDSVGFGNDIIPKNVDKNLNFISDKDYLFNDGPNIARSVKNTEVINHLRSENHTEIDESQDVHFEIMTNITNVLKEHKTQSKFQRLTDLFLSMTPSEKS